MPIKKIPFFISSIIAIIILTCCNNKETIYDLTDFAIKDTATIVKFRISNNEKNSITISRDFKHHKWMIEDTKYEANTASVKLILETFHRVLVKQDVPKSALNTVINRMSVRHKKVEIFNGKEKPFKTWYIGSPTQDHLGTYMLLQNGENKISKPYITYKPGVYGSLDVRFFIDWKDWRSHKVFHYPNTREIKNISVKFNEENIFSYTIKRSTDNIFLLYNNKNELVNNYDTIQVKHYFTHFNNINYNKIMFANSIYTDSIFNSIPQIEFDLEDENEIVTHVDFWRIKSLQSETGWDKEYGYIRINKNKELLRAQYFNWDILFKSLSFFKRDIIK